MVRSFALDNDFRLRHVMLGNRSWLARRRIFFPKRDIHCFKFLPSDWLSNVLKIMFIFTRVWHKPTRVLCWHALNSIQFCDLWQSSLLAFWFETFDKAFLALSLGVGPYVKHFTGIFLDVGPWAMMWTLDFHDVWYRQKHPTSFTDGECYGRLHIQHNSTEAQHQ